MTYCKGCAFLFLTQEFEPLCLAGAEFRPGPVRPDVDVSGIVPAASRNLYNDCTLKKIVSIRAIRIKRYLLRGGNVTTRRLEQYPREQEAREAEDKRLQRKNYVAERYEDEPEGFLEDDEDEFGSGEYAETVEPGEGDDDVRPERRASDRDDEDADSD